MKQGDNKSASKDFAGALKDYQAAHAIMHAPTTGLALAKTQIEQGLLVEARDTLLGITAPAKSRSRVRRRSPGRGKRPRRSPRSSPSGSRRWRSPSTARPPTPRRSPSTAPPFPRDARQPRKVNPGQHVVVASVAGFPATRPSGST